MNISTLHFDAAIRRFIEDGEGPGKASGLKNRNPRKGSSGVGYISVPEPSSANVREDEFAKQSRLARYLAGASLGRPREVER